jgi:hypothetical protein
VDVDSIVTRALRKAGEGYAPADVGAATDRFMARRKRRRMGSWAAGAALAGAAIAAAVFVTGGMPEENVAFESEDLGLPRGPISLTDTYVVGGPTSDVEVADGALVVAHDEGRAASLIDPGTGRRTGRLEEAPTALARGRDALYGVDRASGSLYAFRLPDAEPRNARTVGPEPTDVAYGGGYVWVASAGGRPDRYVVSQYVAESFEPVGTYRVRYPARLEYAYGYLWAAAHDGGLVRIDPDTRRATTVTEVGPASDVDAGFDSIWVYALPSRRFDARVVRLDRTGGRVLDEVRVRGFFGQIEVDETVGVWVLSSVTEYERDLVRIRPEEGPDESVRLEGGPFEMSGGRGALWVVDGQSLKRFEAGD